MARKPPIPLTDRRIPAWPQQTDPDELRIAAARSRLPGAVPPAGGHPGAALLAADPAALVDRVVGDLHGADPVPAGHHVVLLEVELLAPDRVAPGRNVAVRAVALVVHPDEESPRSDT